MTDRMNAEGIYMDHPESITVASGSHFSPLAPRVSEVNALDIAQALSRICRYGGHVGHFLSVARHSLWVSEELEDMGHPDLALHGLLHDAAEAYIGDLVRPLKHGTKYGAGYLAVETQLESIIAIKFGLVFPWPDEVAIADRHVLIERELAGGERWNHRGNPDVDKADWLGRYLTLNTRREL